LNPSRLSSVIKLKWQFLFALYINFTLLRLSMFKF
jgi:hypothetical protein